MNSEQLRQRGMQFSLRVMRFVRLLPSSTEGYALGKQLLRSATSSAANYRAACLGRSLAEFYAKLCIAVEEIDESTFWLELVKESGMIQSEELTALMQESKELTYIYSSSRKTTKKNLDAHKKIKREVLSSSHNNQITK